MRNDKNTAAVLLSMLRENTGRHMLDSGGAYGRHFERNAKLDDDTMQRRPASTMEARAYQYGDKPTRLELNITHDVFHWLAERVEYMPNLQRLFDWYVRTHDADNAKPWLELMTEFADYFVAREERKGRDAGGIYQDGGPFTVNTYNNEDLLSQTLQYIYINSDHYGEFILLQIHGGCDVRGGYTAPKLFSCSIEEYSILDNARASVYCTVENEHNWYSDDGHNFGDNGSFGGGFVNLEDYPVVEVEDDGDIVTRVDDAAQAVLPDVPRGEQIIGYVQVKDGKAYCPKCGGLLAASAY